MMKSGGILDKSGAIAIYAFAVAVVCGLLYVFYWGATGVIGGVLDAIKATTDPRERAGQWVAAAIVFHAFWTARGEK